MRVLVACEESQRVCQAFRDKGHEAYSCDILEPSGGHPEWHILGDAVPLVNGDCTFRTMDGAAHTIDGKWDLIIAHPPCTYLSTAATQCHSTKCYTKEQIANRTMKRIQAMNFFMSFVNADCERIAIENPTGVMNTCFRKPDQSIHPYYFADSIDDAENYATKKTGLWLKGLEPLKYEIKLPNPMDNAESWGTGKKKNWTESNHGSSRRSKTFPGIAKAMAEQWGTIEADRKTEPTISKMEQVDKDINVRSKDEPQRNMAEDIVESFGFKAESYRQAKAKTEPNSSEKPNNLERSSE